MFEVNSEEPNLKNIFGGKMKSQNRIYMFALNGLTSGDLVDAIKNNGLRSPIIGLSSLDALYLILYQNNEVEHVD